MPVSEEWGAALRRYVENGGTLLLCAGGLQGPGAGRLGIPASTGSGEADAFRWTLSGATPVVVFALDRPAWEKLGMAGLAAVVVARHAGNLVRLARGDEPELEPERDS